VRFNREEYIELKTFGRIERQMFVQLFEFMPGVYEEWRRQGATEQELDLSAFDWDYVATVDCGGRTDYRAGLGIGQKCVIMDNDDLLVERDELGRTTKLYKKAATIPLPLDYPVKDMQSWLGIKRFFEFHEGRIDWDAVENARKMQASGSLVIAHIPGAFNTPRELMGDENACICYYENPELMHSIIDTVVDTSVQVYERISQKLVIDQVFVGEDLAGKSGPLVGPLQIKQFFKPYFSKVWDLLSSRGTRIFTMDTDGNVDAILADLIECGITDMYPMEPAAGMDIVSVRKRFGKRLSLAGGIDKHVLRLGKDDIRRELEYKMQSLMQNGGTEFSLDHRIPNGTPLENYRYYVDLGREILNLPPRKNYQTKRILSAG
jgi:uroporphyrinogen-III decarboxylase